MRKHVGPLEYVGNLGDAARLMERAWVLVADAFAEQQVREYAAALHEQRRPRFRMHPWIPGLHWHRTHVNKGHQEPLPPEVMYVLRDILGLERLGVIETHQEEVVRRIRDDREGALWEIRAASQYAPAGIKAEWSGLTDRTPGAPDVRIPAFDAEIEVKWIGPRDEIANDFYKLFEVLDDAWSQIADRAERRQHIGPSAVLVALPGATSLDHWKDEPIFRETMNDRLGRPEYTLVSAMVFATEPYAEMRPNGQQFYGGRAWHLTNPNAVRPWPDDLPLVTDET